MNIINRVYNKTVRPFLPNRIGVLNGVAAPFPKYLDQNIVNQDYEESLIAGIRSMTEVGDKVTVIGGGWGISAVVAARYTGREGEVVVYEAVPEQVKKVNQVAALNKVEDRIDVRQGAFGDRVYNTMFDLEPGSFTTTDEIPETDFLVMDCEGCEEHVLENLTIEPERVLVETHGNFGFPTEDTRELLRTMGYDITYDAVELEDKDVCVLGGEL